MQKEISEIKPRDDNDNTNCIGITHRGPGYDTSLQNLFRTDTKICWLPDHKIRKFANAYITNDVRDTVGQSTVGRNAERAVIPVVGRDG
jgi:hypothetical protein